MNGHKKAVNDFKEKSENKVIGRLLQACIREKLLTYHHKEDILFIPLRDNIRFILVTQVQFFKLGKIKINGEIILIDKKNFKIVKNMDNFLSILSEEIFDKLDKEKWQVFVKEVKNCVENCKLLANFMCGLNKKLEIAIKKNHSRYLIKYVADNYSKLEQFIFFESWASDGHPYHPCHKTKLGFSQEDYKKYSPEFNRNICLPLVAIEKNHTHIGNENKNFNYTKWFAANYRHQWQDYKKMFKKTGLSMNDYYPFFVHPWQYDHIIKGLFKSLIDNKKLIFLKNKSINTSASLSFRTMLVKNDMQAPNIKLSVAVHSTSGLRTISPASIENGPKFSQVLKKILCKENHFAGCLRLTYETCSLHIKHQNQDIAKQLAIIYRDNPVTLVEKNHVPIVAAALYQETPFKKMPLFIELISVTLGNDLHNAKKYFQRYCKIVIRGHLDLFLIYGIALEGHQQNTIAVFKNFYPAYIISRDLGGIMVHLPTLNSKCLTLDLLPASSTVTDISDEATHKFLHSVIQYHLGELAQLLAQYYHVPENVFWKVIKQVLLDRFRQLKNKVPAKRWQHEYKRFFQDNWKIKSLLQMRLKDIYRESIYIAHKNPFRDIE